MPAIMEPGTPISTSSPQYAKRSWQMPHAGRIRNGMSVLSRTTQTDARIGSSKACAWHIGPVSAQSAAESTRASHQMPVRNRPCLVCAAAAITSPVGIRFDANLIAASRRTISDIGVSVRSTVRSRVGGRLPSPDGYCSTVPHPFGFVATTMKRCVRVDGNAFVNSISPTKSIRKPVFSSK